MPANQRQKSASAFTAQTELLDQTNVRLLGELNANPRMTMSALGRRVGMEEVKPRLAKHLGGVFGLEMRTEGREELLERLERAEQALAVPA